MKSNLLFCLVLLSLAGCASLSEEECRTADWQMIGFEDGTRGKPLNTIGDHRKACAKVAVVPDMQAYETGHRKGLQTYCTPQNGYILGQSGSNFNGICSGINERQFHRGYEEGRLRYDLQRDLSALEKQHEALTKQLQHLSDELAETEAALLDETLPREQRRVHLQTVRDLEREKVALEDEWDASARQIETRGQDLQHLIDQQQRQGLF